MNRKIVFYMLGRILQIEGFLMLIPTVVGLVYTELEAVWLLLSAAVAFTCGTLLRLIFKKCDRTVFAREGFAIVALSWVAISLVGALPFYLSGEIPRFASAFFETVSGFTTTGSSAVADVTVFSRCNLFWRSFTHWVGGMGILVFIMAVFPSESGRNVHIMRAEMPGPIVGKLVPRLRDTAKYLYLIYLGLTVVQVTLLLFGGMSLYESLTHTFGTAGTGGFGIKPDSVASYSPYCQWVITVFMLIFGINFNLYYLLLIGRAKSAFKSSELWCYLGIVAVAVTAIVINMSNLYASFGENLRHSAFQVASIITTTGYTTKDFNSWPEFSKMILLVLMFIGGCAGSTAGGLKVSRVMLMIKTVKRDLRHLLHPRSVNSVRLEGKPVDSETMSSVGGYVIIYMLIFFILLLLLSLEPFDFTTTFTSVATCFNNVGPGLGSVGPTGSFAIYSDASQWLLSFAMLLGRLEIFPLLLALSPNTWMRK